MTHDAYDSNVMLLMSMNEVRTESRCICSCSAGQQKTHDSCAVACCLYQGVYVFYTRYACRYMMLCTRWHLTSML